MVGFSELVDRVIKGSNIVLLVIDARKVHESINHEIENKILSFGKKIIYVINKCDLITKQEQSKIRLHNSVQISAAKHWGTLVLLKRIMRLAGGKEVIVGVVGYPNTGKSTVINALKGRHSVLTSPISGFTKSITNVRVNRKIILIDTPGVIPYSERVGIKHVITGIIDADKIKDIEGTALELIKELDGKIEDFFGVERNEDVSETLEQIALKKNILRKGGVADTTRMALEIVRMWQRGKIK